MKKQRISVKVADLTTNKGQLGWLPSNPRQWTQEDVERTKKSLETDPDFLEERPILVIKDGKKWIAFAGNLRTTALKELQPYWDEVGVVQYIPETEEDKHTIKRRAMLDNGSFGAWDFDALANEWDDEPLTDWGVPAWDTKGEGEPKEKTDLSDQLEYNYRLEITCADEKEQERLYNELTAKGYQCRVLTL